MRSPTNIAKGAAAGFVAGLAACWAMDRFASTWSKLADGHRGNTEEDAREWQERAEGENANELVAQRAARAALGRRLDDEELKVASPIVHYLFGGTMAALYGAAAERSEGARFGFGAGFGTALWIAADEIAVPLLGLSRGDDYPVEHHAQALGAHLVFGMTAEAVRRLLRGAGTPGGRHYSRQSQRRPSGLPICP